MTRIRILTALFVLVALQAAAFAGIYQIDPKHSHIRFTVKHMRLFKVHGKFRKFHGTITFDKETVVVEKAVITVNANSLDTNNHERDIQLRTDAFLDTRKYPEITFSLRNSKSLGANRLALVGEFTLHGVTMPVKFEGEYIGSGTDLCRNQRVIISAKGKINRADFGITRQEMMEDGIPMYADEVILDIELAGVLVDSSQMSFKCGNYPASRTRM